MSTLLTVKQVKSLTVGFAFPETYDTGRIEEIKVYLGKNVYPHTIDGRVVKCQIKSDDTAVMYGANRLSFWLDDSIIGVYPVYCGNIIFEYTNAIEHNESVNTGFDLLVNLTISETAITVGDVMYNYVKGDKGDPFTYDDFTPEQISELQQPAADTIASVQAVEQSVEQAEALRVTAEQARQTNTATAIQNAETATTNASNAAGLANEKAGLADQKATLANDAATQANTARDGANSAAQSATNLVNSYATDLAAKELKSNKQNNLTPDGTGTKFPTVDAVNAGLAGKIDFRKMALLRGSGYLTYNSTTGFYEMNGLTDITEEQMMQIYNYTAQSVLLFGDEQFVNAPIRTTYRRSFNGALGSGSFRYTFSGSIIEVYYCPMLINVAVGMFYSCSNLNTVKTLTLNSTQAANYTGMFMNCTALVNCEIKYINTNLSFQWSPLLTLESLQYLITNRNNGTKAITITVHPTVFAKLTDNTNYPTWYAVNQDALTKYITFASA